MTFIGHSALFFRFFSGSYFLVFSGSRVFSARFFQQGLMGATSYPTRSYGKVLWGQLHKVLWKVLWGRKVLWGQLHTFKRSYGVNFIHSTFAIDDTRPRRQNPHMARPLRIERPG